jgi:pimeloyl-ACP methyl ester carboxylesterase
MKIEEQNQSLCGYKKIINFAFLIGLFFGGAVVQAQTDKTPIIIIPGLVGSELVNQKTGEKVWFNLGRSKRDDLRQPLSPDLAAMRDDLVPRGALRSVKIGLAPREALYGSLINVIKQSGYQETSWETPKAANAVYIFAYDWRRDNVENARLLIGKIERLKRDLGQPDLKFNVVAHSMGGLLARYAAMYGDADLPQENEKIEPDWSGAKHFDKIILLGTPNGGSLVALESLAKRFALFSFNYDLPFVQNFTKFDVFTIPSVFQLLPTNLRAYDENLQPIKIDVFDEQTWRKYNWGALEDRKFSKEFDAADRQNAPAYFRSALDRAKRFHQALNAESKEKNSVAFSLVGGDCQNTADAVVVFKDKQSNVWRTIFKPIAFTNSSGRKITRVEMRKLIIAPSDGIVSKNSLLAADALQIGGQAQFHCEGHNKLVANSAIQAAIFRLLAEN